jgi:hypothetical protein
VARRHILPSFVNSVEEDFSYHFSRHTLLFEFLLVKCEQSLEQSKGRLSEQESLIYGQTSSSISWPLKLVLIRLSLRIVGGSSCICRAWRSDLVTLAHLSMNGNNSSMNRLLLLLPPQSSHLARQNTAVEMVFIISYSLHFCSVTTMLASSLEGCGLSPSNVVCRNCGSHISSCVNASVKNGNR